MADLQVATAGPNLHRGHPSPPRLELSQCTIVVFDIRVYPGLLHGIPCAIGRMLWCVVPAPHVMVETDAVPIYECSFGTIRRQL